MRLLAFATVLNVAIAAFSPLFYALAGEAPGIAVAIALTLAVGSFGAAITPFVALVVVDDGQEVAEFVLIVLNGLILIVVFASGHFALGFGDGSETAHGFSAALYFSTVTFTTLGYGDLLPSEDARALAALQALFGYVYLGLLVGAASNLKDRR